MPDIPELQCSFIEWSGIENISTLIWWAHQDLNLEPTDYESAALTN